MTEGTWNSNDWKLIRHIPLQWEQSQTDGFLDNVWISKPSPLIQFRIEPNSNLDPEDDTWSAYVIIRVQDPFDYFYDQKGIILSDTCNDLESAKQLCRAWFDDMIEPFFKEQK